MTKANTTNLSPQDYRKCDFIPYDFVRMCIDNVQNVYATYYVVYIYIYIYIYITTYFLRFSWSSYYFENTFVNQPNGHNDVRENKKIMNSKVYT